MSGGKGRFILPLPGVRLVEVWRKQETHLGEIWSSVVVSALPFGASSYCRKGKEHVISSAGREGEVVVVSER